MAWYWFFLVVLVFVVLEVFTGWTFSKNRKMSEALSIATFLLCAWVFTEEGMATFGAVLFVVAIVIDLVRRRGLSGP